MDRTHEGHAICMVPKGRTYEEAPRASEPTQATVAHAPLRALRAKRTRARDARHEILQVLVILPYSSITNTLFVSLNRGDPPVACFAGSSFIYDFRQRTVHGPIHEYGCVYEAKRLCIRGQTGVRREAESAYSAVHVDKL